MSKKLLLDLSMQLSANSAELKKGLAESRAEMKKMQQSSRDIGKDVAMQFGKIALAIGVVKKAFQAAESTLRANQRLNDELDKTLGGVRNGLQFLQIEISSMNFSNLQNGFFDAIAAGREFAEQMDIIADKTRAVTWRASDIDLKVAELRLTMRDDELDVQTRLNAAYEVQNLLQEKMNDGLAVTSQKQDAIRNRLRDTLKLTDNQMNLVEQWLKHYDDLGAAGFENVDVFLEMRKEAQAMQKELRLLAPNTEEYNRKLAESLEMSFSIGDLYKSLSPDEKFILDLVEDFGDLGLKISDAMRDELQGIGVEMNVQKIRILNESRMILREINRLRNEAGRGVEEVGTSSRPSAPNMLAPMGAGLLGIDFAPQSIEIRNMAGDLDLAFTSAMALGDAFDRMFNTMNLIYLATDGLQAGFDSLFGDGERGAHAFIGSLLGVIQGLFATAIAQMITAESQKGLFGLATGLVGVTALTSFWNNKVPSFADGGLIYGETLARVGEYPGAASNPEVIAPLNKLKGLIGDGGVGGGTVRFIIEDDMLVGILDHYNKKQTHY